MDRYLMRPQDEAMQVEYDGRMKALRNYNQLEQSAQ